MHGPFLNSFRECEYELAEGYDVAKTRPEGPFVKCRANRLSTRYKAKTTTSPNFALRTGPSACVNSSTSGFSLVEVLCAFVILSVCLLVMVQTTQVGISRILASRSYTAMEERITLQNLDTAAQGSLKSSQSVSSNLEWIVVRSSTLDGKVTDKSLLVLRNSEK